MPWVIKADYTWDQLLELTRQLDVDIVTMTEGLGGPEGLDTDDAWKWLKENSDEPEVEGYIKYHNPSMGEPPEHRDVESLPPKEQFKLAQDYLSKSMESMRKMNAPTETNLTERDAFLAIMERRKDLQAIADLGAPEAGAPPTDQEYLLGVTMRRMKNNAIRASDDLTGGHIWTNTPKRAAQELFAMWSQVPYNIIGSRS